MLIALIFANETTDGFRNRFHIGNYCVFKRRTVRRGGMNSVQAADGRIQFIKAPISHLSGDLRANAAGRKRFIDNQQSSGLGD